MNAAAKEPSSAPKRRGFRFSLRTLIVVVTLASAGFGWFGSKWRAARQQRAAVAAIHELGGVVFYDYSYEKDDYRYGGTVNHRAAEPPNGPALLDGLLGREFFARVVGVDCNKAFRTGGPAFTDAALEQVGNLTHLKFLNLDGMKITDAGLFHLRGLLEMQDLRLSHAAVTDAGLVNLQDLTQLKRLRLDHTQTTDDGLRQLQGLMQLESLDLNDTKITDAGLIHLQGLKNLKQLFVERTQITDAGLLHLHVLSQLEILNPGGTKITDRGYQELQEVLPNLWIWK